jgi:hypothetical protein
MSETFKEVTSPGGTTIAFDRLGEGPPVIVVCGAMCDRALMRPTAEELAKHFTVFNYDRRGRGGRRHCGCHRRGRRAGGGGGRIPYRGLRRYERG